MILYKKKSRIVQIKHIIIENVPNHTKEHTEITTQIEQAIQQSSNPTVNQTKQAKQGKKRLIFKPSKKS